MARRAPLFDPNGPWPGSVQYATRSQKVDPWGYRQYAEANAELSKQYQRLYHPEQVKWGAPDPGDGPGMMSWREQSQLSPRSTTYRHNSVFQNLLSPSGAIESGGLDLFTRKVLWTLFAAGAVYGLVAAKSKRGYTPLVFAAVAAVLMNRAITSGITFDDRLFNRDII